MSLIRYPYPRIRFVGRIGLDTGRSAVPVLDMAHDRDNLVVVRTDPVVEKVRSLNNMSADSARECLILERRFLVARCMDQLLSHWSFVTERLVPDWGGTDQAPALDSDAEQSHSQRRDRYSFVETD
jgi:hypothetical protein